MNSEQDKLIRALQFMVSLSGPVTGRRRRSLLKRIADALRQYGGYRWVGLYDVDHGACIVCNVAFSGPGAPAHPQFPITKGLTSAAVAEKGTINVGDVAADSRYLTAFSGTQSEIIVPIFDPTGQAVVGTIDIESDVKNAFTDDMQSFLERCSDVIKPLWLWP